MGEKKQEDTPILFKNRGDEKMKGKRSGMAGQ